MISCDFHVSDCFNKVDLVVAMDESGSIDRVNYYIMQDFVRDVIYGIGVSTGSRVGVLTYSTDANIRFNLKAYNTTDEVLNAMNFPYTGGKYIALGHTLCHQHMHIDLGPFSGPCLRTLS